MDQIIRDLKKWGMRGCVVLRHDQEDAIRDLCEEVMAQRAKENLQTTMRQFDEVSPVGESASNGVIEAGVRVFEGVLRTHKFSLEERLQQKVDVRSPRFAWLVEHVADLVTKAQRGEDGMTPFKRLRQREFGGEFLAKRRRNDVEVA